MARGGRGKSAGAVRIDFIAGHAEFVKGVRKNMSAMDKFKHRAMKIAMAVKNHWKAIVAAIGAFVVSVGFAIKKMTDYSSKLVEAGRATGFTTKQLEGLRSLFQGDGIGIAQTDRALKEFNSRLGFARRGIGQYTRAFDDMGVAVKNTDGTMKSNNDVLVEVAKKLGGMKDQAKATSLAYEIFGRSGKDLIPILRANGGALEDAIKHANRYRTITDEQHKQNKDLGQGFTDLKENFVDLIQRGLQPMIPTLTNAVRHINNVIVSLKGGMERVGKVVTGVLEGIANIGRFMGLIKDEKFYRDRISTDQNVLDAMRRDPQVMQAMLDVQGKNYVQVLEDRIKKDKEILGHLENSRKAEKDAAKLREALVEEIDETIEVMKEVKKKINEDPYNHIHHAMVRAKAEDLGFRMRPLDYDPARGNPGTATGSRFTPLSTQYLRSDSKMRSPIQAEIAANIRAAELAEAGNKVAVEIVHSTLRRMMRDADKVPQLRQITDTDLGSGRRSARPNPNQKDLPSQPGYIPNISQKAYETAALVFETAMQDFGVSIEFEIAKKKRAKEDVLAKNIDAAEQAGINFAAGLQDMAIGWAFDDAQTTRLRIEAAIASGRALRGYDAAAFARARSRRGPKAADPLDLEAIARRRADSRRITGAGQGIDPWGGMDQATLAYGTGIDRTTLEAMRDNKLTERLENYNAAAEKSKKLTEDIANGLNSWLDNLFDNFTNMRDAIEDLLSDIAKMLIRQHIIAPWAEQTGGFLGSLFPSGGSSSVEDTFYKIGKSSIASSTIDFSSPGMLGGGMGAGRGVTIINNIQSTDGPGVRAALAEATPGIVRMATSNTMDTASRYGQGRTMLRGSA